MTTNASSPDVLPSTGPARGLLSRLRPVGPTMSFATATDDALGVAPAGESRYTPAPGAGVFARLLVEQEEAERAAAARRHDAVPAPRTAPDAAPSAPRPEAGAGAEAEAEAQAEVTVPRAEAAPLREALQSAALQAEVAALRAGLASLEAVREELREERERAARLERELVALREVAGRRLDLPELRAATEH